MTLLPDDEPEKLPSPAVIYPGEVFLPALAGGEGPVSPARATCFPSIHPAAGRPWPRSLVSSPACSAPRPWSPAAGAPAAPSRNGRDRAAARHRPGNRHCQHLPFRAEGRGEGSWMLRLMDVESFQHIRAVRNLRGSRLPRGRALPPDEIRALFSACGLITPVSGCAMRRCWVSFSAAACAARRRWGWI